MEQSTIYIMGVSGSGKSTIGKMLSEKANIPFFDGDDFHPVENIEKMAVGLPLDDSDRQGWLHALNRLAIKEAKIKGAIIACSALKKSYRDILKNGLGEKCFFIFLKGDFETIKKRMEKRGGHFMPAHLLKSQFDALEPPEDALIFEIKIEPELIVETILEMIFLK